MAQRQVLVMTDDLSGGDASETIRFSLDSGEYEIDLNEKNAKALRSDFQKYIDAARRVRPARLRKDVGRGAGRGGDSGLDTAAVREWAKANGHDPAPRGRLSRTILDAYRAAN